MVYIGISIVPQGSDKKHPHNIVDNKLLPAKWEIEHIFPQKWQTNYFPDESDAIIKEKIEHIGNKLPFEKKLNIVAGNGYFGKKKKEYTASKITITKTMGTSDVADWNMDSIMKRDIRVSDQIIKTLNKWNNLPLPKSASTLCLLTSIVVGIYKPPPVLFIDLMMIYSR